MPFPLIPTYKTKELTDLTPEKLRNCGIRFLMMDFDNTIVPYTTNEPTEKMDAWLKMMVASDIQLCVVSNTRKDRVNSFCAPYGIPVVMRAKKPGTGGIFEALGRFGYGQDEAALVGDQIFTDTFGAGNAGVRSILVKAIHNHNIWLKLRHVAELPFIIAAGKRSI